MSAGRLSRAAENRESGVNPERYRHCERGGIVLRRKSVIGDYPEKTVHNTRRGASQETYSNVCGFVDPGQEKQAGYLQKNGCGN